jgi:hypothetical protein
MKCIHARPAGNVVIGKNDIVVVGVKLARECVGRSNNVNLRGVPGTTKDLDAEFHIGGFVFDYEHKQ